MSQVSLSQRPHEKQYFEYQQAHELFRHYDSTSWTIASVLLAVSAGLIGFSFQLRETPIAVASASFLLYLAWIVLDMRLTHYTHRLLDRLEELERTLGLKIHLHIVDTDRLRILGMRQVLYPAIIPIGAFWLNRVFPNLSSLVYVGLLLVYVVVFLGFHLRRLDNLQKRRDPP